MHHIEVTEEAVLYRGQNIETLDAPTLRRALFGLACATMPITLTAKAYAEVAKGDAQSAREHGPTFQRTGAGDQAS